MLHIRTFSTKTTKLSSKVIIDNFFKAGPTWSLSELSITDTSNTVDINLDKLSELAHLNLTNPETIKKDLKCVLDMVSKVQEGAKDHTEQDTLNATPIVDRTRLRSDVITEKDLSKSLLSNAKNTESGYVLYY